MSNTKTVLFLNRKAPHGSIHAQEALDAVLMASAYEQHIELLFIDDGIYQLLSGQAPQAAGLKNFAAGFRALEMYGVEDLYVEAESLELRGINSNELLVPVTLINSEQCAQKLANAKVVLSF